MTIMVCNIKGHKAFLVVCNIGLLFTGLAILILGMKMKDMMSIIMLDQIPVILQTVNAVIVVGCFITMTGGTGICGTTYEVVWLMILHLGGLLLIIVMEFAVGITLITVKNTVEEFMEHPDCMNFCQITLQTVILDLAMPSAIIMMSIIIMQALMIYSAAQLFFHFKDNPKDLASTNTAVVAHNVSMQNVVRPTSQTSRLPSHTVHETSSHSAYRLPYPLHAGYRIQPQLGSTSANQNLSQRQPFSTSDDPFADPPPYSAIESHASTTRDRENQNNFVEERCCDVTLGNTSSRQQVHG